MKPDQILNSIQMNGFSATPKYLQISNAILSGIKRGQIDKGDIMPSLNELSFCLDVSKDTAERAYKQLKTLGVLGSLHGKGYYVVNTKVEQSIKVLLVFNKLSVHKKVLYDTFMQTLGTDILVDFCVYNNDYYLLEKLLESRKEQYSHYVIIPHFVEGEDQAPKLFNLLPKEKLVLLDKLLPGVTGEYAAAYENFEVDIYSALEQLLYELRKYHTLKIVFPYKSYFPVEILIGFKRFCEDHDFQYEVLNTIDKDEIMEGDLYINLKEEDLVMLIEGVMERDLKIGKQVGVISYNETPLKKVILDGITTISTDFQKMGETAARLVLSNSHHKVQVPFNLIKRASL